MLTTLLNFSLAAQSPICDTILKVSKSHGAFAEERRI